MGQLIDITGNKYGRLTVIKRDGKSKDHQAMWLCECECGNQVRVRSKDLRSGHTTSCGCYNRELVSSQIAGQKFNMLTALTPIGKVDYLSLEAEDAHIHNAPAGKVLQKTL